VILSGDELIAGSALTFEVEVPPAVLHPGNAGPSANGTGPLPGSVRLRPLTVADLQTITRAAKESDSLTATLMVQRALVEPELTIAQVSSLHIGLVQFLLERVNEVSGIVTSVESLEAAVDAPLSRATYLLAERFGWTPQEVGELTLGQVLLNLKLLGERARTAAS
jgi:hypothetical protein